MTANRAAPAGAPIPPVAAPQATHGCVRCGAPVPLDTAMCERCNPLGLRQPSASQAHGTVVVGIVVAVIVLAIAGKLVLAGMGPFVGTISGVVAEPQGLGVTLTVTNKGTRDGSATCRVYDANDPGIGPDNAYILSPTIGAGATRSFSKVVTNLGTTVRPLAVECAGP